MSTLCCFGPMSKNSIDSIVELERDYKKKFYLISSRRQIETDKIGKGYVNNFSTEQYTNYLKEIKAGKNIILCRDHGGPNQGIKTFNDNRKSIFESKVSFESDIKNGFKYIHIDTSKLIKSDHDFEILFELLDFCNSLAKKYKKNILYEVGTEEQSMVSFSPQKLDYTLNKIEKGCKKFGLPFPKFIVAQTGTFVKNTQNIGTFERKLRVENQLPAPIQIFKVLDICKKYGISLKQHNSDYLSNNSLRLLKKIGVNAINVAPELGFVETKAIIDLLNIKNAKKEKDRLIESCIKKGMWKKWVYGNVSDLTKTYTSCHYLFSTDEFYNFKLKFIKDYLNNDHRKFENICKKSIKKAILRYYFNLNIIK